MIVRKSVATSAFGLAMGIGCAALAQTGIDSCASLPSIDATTIFACARRGYSPIAVSVCGKKTMERKRAAALAPAAHVG
jgi:hypothetical protein